MFKPATSLTVENAMDVLAAGLQAIAAGQSSIDLSALVNVDSSAVAIVLAWQRAARQQGYTLELGVLPTNLQSLADLYGASALLDAPTSASDRHPTSSH